MLTRSHCVSGWIIHAAWGVGRILLSFSRVSVFLRDSQSASVLGSDASTHDVVAPARCPAHRAQRGVGDEKSGQEPNGPCVTLTPTVD